MGPIRSPSRESARHEDAQKRLISATAAAQKRRVGGLAYESPAALRGWRSGEQAGTCSAVLGAAGESRERGRGWPPRAAKAKYRTILRRSERKAVSWLWGGGWLRGVKSPSCTPPALLSLPSSPCGRIPIVGTVHEVLQGTSTGIHQSVNSSTSSAHGLSLRASARPSSHL